MFQILLNDWLKENIESGTYQFSMMQTFAMINFAKWLDSRSPTTACSGTPAIELLERIRDKVLTDENYDADEIVREVDAVLKTASVS